MIGILHAIGFRLQPDTGTTHGGGCAAVRLDDAANGPRAYLHRVPIAYQCIVGVDTIYGWRGFGGGFWRGFGGGLVNVYLDGGFVRNVAVVVLDGIGKGLDAGVARGIGYLAGGRIDRNRTTGRIAHNRHHGAVNTATGDAIVDARPVGVFVVGQHVNNHRVGEVGTGDVVVCHGEVHFVGANVTLVGAGAFAAKAALIIWGAAVAAIVCWDGVHGRAAGQRRVCPRFALGVGQRGAFVVFKRGQGGVYHLVGGVVEPPLAGGVPLAARVIGNVVAVGAWRDRARRDKLWGLRRVLILCLTLMAVLRWVVGNNRITYPGFVLCAAGVVVVVDDSTAQVGGGVVDNGNVGEPHPTAPASIPGTARRHIAIEDSAALAGAVAAKGGIANINVGGPQAEPTPTAPVVVEADFGYQTTALAAALVANNGAIEEVELGAKVVDTAAVAAGGVVADNGIDDIEAFVVVVENTTTAACFVVDVVARFVAFNQAIFNMQVARGVVDTAACAAGFIIFDDAVVQL